MIKNKIKKINKITKKKSKTNFVLVISKDKNGLVEPLSNLSFINIYSYIEVLGKTIYEVGHLT